MLFIYVSIFCGWVQITRARPSWLRVEHISFYRLYVAWYDGFRIKVDMPDLNNENTGQNNKTIIK